MKRQVFAGMLLFMVFSCSGYAQNLVPNYSFEDTITCPVHLNQFAGYLTNWTGGSGGTSYFNALCSSNDEVGVPQNTWGYEYAHTGNAYAGIYTFADSLYDPPDANLRDYIEDTLTTTLIAATKYYVTFYVNLSDSSKYACNDIGTYFSDSALKWTGYVKPYITPQVANNAIKNPLTNKVNWMKVSGNFVAKGGEKYVIIGNFKNDAHSDTVFVNSNGSSAHIWTEAYYYIDDVIVSPDSNYADSITAVNEVRDKNEELRAYPNPASTVLNVELQVLPDQNTNICLFNNIGELVVCDALRYNLTTINTVNLPSGMYYYRVTDANGAQLRADKVVIIH